MERKVFLRRLRGLVCTWLALLLILPASLALPAVADEPPQASSWDDPETGLKRLAKPSTEDNVYDFEDKEIDITGNIYIPLDAGESITLKNADFVCSSESVDSMFMFYAAGGDATVTLDDIAIDGGAQPDPDITHPGAALDFTTSGGALTAEISNSTLQYWSSSEDRGGGVYVGEDVTFTMTDSSIENCSARTGGGVYVSIGGTFTMEGSTISNCTANDNYGNGGGGGVYVDQNSSIFNMENSDIILCAANDNGGGVLVREGSTFNMMDNSSIKNCTARSGGGVDNSNDFTMTDSTITDCEANGGDGGGVYSDDTFTMTGSTIIGCKASGDGGGVCVRSDNPFVMTDSSVTDCKASSYGGGVYIEESEMSGEKGIINLSDKAVIGSNTANGETNNLHLASNSYAVIDSETPLDDGSRIGVTTGTAPTEDSPVDVTDPDVSNSKNYSGYFFADDSARYHIVNSAYGDNVVQLAFGPASDTTPPTVFQDRDRDYGTVYSTIKGSGGTWTQDDPNGYSFTIDAPFSKFKSISVDGETVDPRNYDKREGSTIITLRTSYLETLPVGMHTLRVIFSDGYAQTSFYVGAWEEKNPNTGFEDPFLVFWKALDLLKK